MQDHDPLDLIHQLRAWVNKSLSSLNEAPLAEARARYREVQKVVNQLEKLHIPISDDIISEKESLERWLSVSSEREKLASLSKELLVLSREINHQLRNTKEPGTPLGERASPKKLVVTFPDGMVVRERNATATFIRTIQLIGLERVAELTFIRRSGYPVVSSRRNESGGYIHEVDGYYIETNSSTKAKAEQLQHVNQALEIGIKIEVLEV